MGDRSIAFVLGVPSPGIPELDVQCILVALDLAPAETATLDSSKVIGIVTEHGGRTSHTAILAAQMGIPAAVNVAGATGIAEGTPILVDGETGQVHINPSSEMVDMLKQRAARRTAALAGAAALA